MKKLSTLPTNIIAKRLFQHPFFLQTVNFHWIFERITLKIINFSTHISPEDLSTGALLALVPLCKAPGSAPQHCPNAFPHCISPEPPAARKTGRNCLVILNTHTQKIQLLQNWCEARNENVYEVIVSQHFCLFLPVLSQQSEGFHRQPPRRLLGNDLLSTMWGQISLLKRSSPVFTATFRVFGLLIN